MSEQMHARGADACSITMLDPHAVPGTSKAHRNCLSLLQISVRPGKEVQSKEEVRISALALMIFTVHVPVFLDVYVRFSNSARELPTENARS